MDQRIIDEAWAIVDQHEAANGNRIEGLNDDQYDSMERDLAALAERNGLTKSSLDRAMGSIDCSE